MAIFRGKRCLNIKLGGKNIFSVTTICVERDFIAMEDGNCKYASMLQELPEQQIQQLMVQVVDKPFSV